MKDTATITGLEEKYKKLLLIKLGADKRLAVNSPSSKYPEPAFVYVKSVKTEKVIAIRLDGEDKTMRFWDYIDDDDYSSEDGVWDKMTDKGLENFINKFYAVADKAVDIEFFGLDGECDDYYAGVADYEQTVENAKKAVKKYGEDADFVFAKYSNFYGDVQYGFDANFRQIVKR